MRSKMKRPAGRLGAGNVLELNERRRGEYPQSAPQMQGCCVECGTRFDLVPTQGRCRRCLGHLLHYRACHLLREAQS